MRRETRERIRREQDYTPIRREDDTPDSVYEDVALPHVTARLKQYHAWCSELYPTYAARVNGTLDAYREQWLRERRAHLAATYGE